MDLTCHRNSDIGSTTERDSGQGEGPVVGYSKDSRIFSEWDRNQERALRMGMHALTHWSCDKGTAAAVWRRTTG